MKVCHQGNYERSKSYVSFHKSVTEDIYLLVQVPEKDLFQFEAQPSDIEIHHERRRPRTALGAAGESEK